MAKATVRSADITSTCRRTDSNVAWPQQDSEGYFSISGATFKHANRVAPSSKPSSRAVPGKLLMLAYFYPPVVASGSLRPASFTAHLWRYGYTTRVLSTDPTQVHPPAATDPSLYAMIADDVEIERLRYTDRRAMALRLRDALLRRRHSPNAVSALDSIAQASEAPRRQGQLRAWWRCWVERAFMFPDQQKDWGRAAVRHARRFKGTERPDVVFATGSPWSALLAGADIAELLDVPFVADFRDPWSVNTKIGLSEALEARARRLEADVVRRATRVIANTDALRDWFVRTYPASADKVVTITNGINPRLREVLDALPAAPREPAAIDLRYYGTVSRQRMPWSLVRALEALLDAGVANARTIKVTFTGAWARIPADVLAVLERLEQAGILARQQPLPYDACIAGMKGATHLLVLQQGFPLQIPAKIYEYIAIGRPLVVIGGEGATSDLVEKYKLGVVCADDPNAVRAMLETLIRTNGGGVSPDQTAATTFDYATLTGQLAAVLDAAVAEHAARKERTA